MQLHCQYLDVFGADASREILRLASDQRPAFTASRTSPNKLYPDWRKSTVIYEGHLSGVVEKIEREVRNRVPAVMAALGAPPFEVGSLEIQLTSHNDGEYYRSHKDNGSPDTRGRILTFVYYLHAQPKRFRGGELVIYDANGEQIVIEPRNDSMVFFLSARTHEVRAVECPSREFADGRFTVNGWIRTAARAVSAGPFGLNIFGSTRHSALRHPDPRRIVPPRPPAPSVPGSAADASALLDLYSSLYRESRAARSIETRSAIDSGEFYERFYFANRPVLLKGATLDSPSVRRWSPEFFARNYGDIPVEVTANRQTTPDYEVNFRQTVHTVSLREFATRVVEAGESNDLYLVARNYFFENAAFAGLRADLTPPPGLVDVKSGAAGATKMWFGPRGTVTPLHYDEHSILFMQVYGRKRFKLIPSFDLNKVYPRDRYYSAVDPENIDFDRYPLFAQASVAEVVVEPGDVLFLPVGWWHWARSLDVSISVTFSRFLVPGGNTTLSSASQ